MKFDKLNILGIEDDYFEPMAISVDDKNRRRELADLLTDVFLYFFSVYEVHQMHNSTLEKALYEQLLTDKISDAVSKVTGIDGEMSSHIRKLSQEVVETTIKNADRDKDQDKDKQVRQTLHTPDYDTSSANIYKSEESSDSPDTSGDSRFSEEKQDQEPLISEDDDEDEVEELMEREAVANYWLSINRAMLIAKNEANTFLNYSDFVDAKESGYTTKTWLTMLDDKVRDTHEEIDGQTIGIDETFKVGNSELKFPHDWELSPDPNEVINCRCAVTYGK